MDAETSLPPKSERTEKSPLHAVDEGFDQTNEESKPLIGGEQEPTCGALSVTINIVASMVSSSILGSPYSLQQTGVGMGIIISLVGAALTYITLIIMINIGVQQGIPSFQGLMRLGFGRVGFGFITAIQFLQPFGSCISYNIIFGNLLTTLAMRANGLIFHGLQGTILENRYLVIFLANLVIIGPISLYRQVSRLSKFSSVKLIADVFLIIIIWIRYASLRTEIPVTEGSWNFARGISLISGSLIIFNYYVVQHNSFLMYRAMSTEKKYQWPKVAAGSSVLSTMVMLIFAIGGYATFTGHVRSDIFENYCYDDDLVNAARIIYIICMSLAYPLDLFICREVVENLFLTKHLPLALWKHIVLTLSLVVLVMLVSFTTDCFGKLLKLSGLVTATTLMFIFPAMLYIKFSDRKLHSLRTVAAMFLGVIGIAIGIVGLVFVTWDMISGNINNGCDEANERQAYCLHENFTETTQSMVYTQQTVLT